MQKAIDHLEKHKVFIEALQTNMIPLSEAYKAIELSFDNQIAEVMETLQEQLGGVVGDLKDITPEEND